MNLSLNRIILFVRDVEGLKNFYHQHFALQIIEEITGEWVVMSAGNCQLALHKISVGFETTDGHLTNAKLVFETTDDLNLLREQLLASGVAMRELKSFGKSPNLFCDGTDPEGNVFQLMQSIS